MADDREPLDGGWGWCILVAAFTGQLLCAGIVPLVGLYLVELQEHFGVGPAAVSFLATEVTFGLPISAVFSGALCQRFGCRLVMICGGAVGSFSTFLASFSTELWQLHILFTISGIAYGISYFPGPVIVSFYFKKRLGLANGIIFAGIGAGFFVMSPVVQALCAEYGWRGSLMIHSAINSNIIICGMILRRTEMEQKVMDAYRSTPRTNPQDSSDNSDPSCCRRVLQNIDETFAFSKLLQNPYFILVAFASILAFGGHLAVIVFTAPKLVNDLDFPKTTASLVMSVYGIIGLLARAFHGLLLDYKLVTVTNLYIISLVISGIQPMFNPLVSSVASQFALIVTYGIGAGIMFPITFLVCRQYVPLDIASSAFGLLITVGGLGNILGTQLMGQLSDVTGSYKVPFYITGGFFWTSAVLVLLVTRCRPYKGHNDEVNGEGTLPGEIISAGELPVEAELMLDDRGVVGTPTKLRDAEGSGYLEIPGDELGRSEHLESSF